MGRAERRAAERRGGSDVASAIPGAAEMREASGYFTAWREGHVPASWRRSIDPFGVRYTRDGIAVRASMEPLAAEGRVLW